MRPYEAFAAKAAADKWRDDVHLFFGDAKRLSHGIARAHHPLGGLPQSEFIAVPRGNRRAWLHRVVMFRGREVVGLMLYLRTLEGGGCIPALDRQFLAEKFRRV